jgi:hypothetical protein
MIYVYVDDNQFIKQVDYVFGIVRDVTGIEFKVSSNEQEILQNKVSIAYVSKLDSLPSDVADTNRIVILNSKKLFGENYMDKQSIPKNVQRFNNGEVDLISIYNSDEDLFINIDEKHIVTNMDLIADMFFMLSRYEEIINQEVMSDEVFERFPASESLAYKFDFIERAIVNEDIDLFAKWIRSFLPDIKIRNIWGDKKFAACLTHDVDWIQKHANIKSALKTSLGLVVKQYRIDGAFRNFVTYIKSLTNHENDMYWTFDYIINCEKRNGFSSSFYFMSGGNSKFDNNYRYDDFRVKKLIENLESSNFECGYHGSFNSYNDISMMKAEKINLDKVVKNKKYGIRQHYLRFKVPNTWRYQEECNFLYDTTLGFADKEGFRAGFCFPFKPYDIQRDTVIDVWEIPLIVMEASLMNSKYRGYTPTEAFNKIKGLIDIVSKYGGVFTFLWHNSSFDKSTLRSKEWIKVYEDSLKYLMDKNCYGSSGKDIILKYESML